MVYNSRIKYETPVLLLVSSTIDHFLDDHVPATVLGLVSVGQCPGSSDDIPVDEGHPKLSNPWDLDQMS